MLLVWGVKIMSLATLASLGTVFIVEVTKRKAISVLLASSSFGSELVKHKPV